MNIEKIKKCPECGCLEIGMGKWGGYAVMQPANKFSFTGSSVYAEVCTNCGLVINLRVEKPEKFKK